MTRVAVTGSTGLIGRSLIASLRADGHVVHRLVRDAAAAQPGDLVWDPARGVLRPDELAGVDAVVHLAGEPIGAARWTAATKRRIRDSRVVGTRVLAEQLAGLDTPPGVLVSASAVGYYGDRGAEVLTERSSAGDDFLAQVCVAWEEAASPAAAAGIRVVHPRTGVVIAGEGPLLRRIERPFRLGLGGRIGSGRQYVPWIALEDEVAALRFCIDGELAGPVNLTAPTPVTNLELTKALGEVLRRPTLLPVPPVALKLALGEMGVTLATTSQRVLPKRLTEAGFVFRHSSLLSALRVALGQQVAGA